MNLQFITNAFYLFTLSFVSYFLYDLKPLTADMNWPKSILLSLYSFKTVLIPCLMLIVFILGSVNDFKTKYFRIGFSFILACIIVLSNGRDFDHDLFLWFYTSIIFAFAPERYALSLAKLIILLSYFMSGFWKLYYSVVSLFDDRLVSYLSIDGLRSIILNYYSEDWIVAIPTAVFFLAGLCVMLLELSGPALYFKRREYLKYWMQFTIVFHMLTVIFMKIEFVGNIVLIGLVFSDTLIPKRGESSQCPH